MQIPTLIRRVTLPIGALLLITACAGGSTAGWTYAPLGPSANPSAAASGAPGSGGPGTAISIETTAASSLAFSPDDFTVAAGATVNLTYVNNSTVPHNIQVFDGADNNAPSLGMTQIAPGPNNSQTLTFTAPTTPGDYFFWCDVHTNQMKGVWHVQ